MSNLNSSTQKVSKIIKQFRIILAISIVYIIFGCLFYHFIEGWHWIDSLYFSVVSLTTVGYGDITPVTAAGKLFTIFYLIFGIGIFGAFINNILKSRIAMKARDKYTNL